VHHWALLSHVWKAISGCELTWSTNSARATVSQVVSHYITGNMKALVIAKKLIGRVVLSLSIVAMLESTSEASLFNGTITVIELMSTGTTAFVEVNGTFAFASACTNPPGPTLNGFVFDYSTSRGKAILQTLTAALLAGKRVNITGGAPCVNVNRAAGQGGSVETMGTVEILQ
jgi:hypothetical protein